FARVRRQGDTRDAGGWRDDQQLLPDRQLCLPGRARHPGRYSQHTDGYAGRLGVATLEAIVGSTTYDLTDDSMVLWVGEDGVGMPDVRRITESSPQQQGNPDIDYRLEPRIFHESFLIAPESLSAQYDRRKSALRVFRPSLMPIKLRWTLDNGDVRQI